VLNVGAGAGSYEPTDRHVLAVEPSPAMRARRPASAVPAIDATAEDVPFDDDAVDAVTALFTLHQWRDLPRGLSEMRRVSRGPVVVLTLDACRLDDFWLSRYWPERLDVARDRFPDIEEVRAGLGAESTVEAVPIPLDCTDGFVEAFYGHPEALLDPDVRAAQSLWQRLDPVVLDRGLAALSDDLDSGRWDEEYGHLRSRPTFTGPLCIVSIDR